MVNVYIDDHKMCCTRSEALIFSRLKKFGCIYPEDFPGGNRSGHISALRSKLPEGVEILSIAGTGQYEIAGLPGKRAPVKSATGFYWTHDIFCRAVEWHLDGLSARQIADRIGQGVTRNAVIGKFNRNEGFIERARKARFLSAPVVQDYEPEPEILIEPEPVGDTCRVRGCAKAPVKYYAHGFCRAHNEARLNDDRERRSAFVCAPLAGYMG